MSTSGELAPSQEIKSFLRVRHGLARQFVLVAAIALVVSMGVLGRWVSEKIESGVEEFAGASAALYINTFIAPHLQELAHRDTFSEAGISALNAVINSPAIRSRVTTVKVWKRDGLIVYSNERSLIGRRFAPSPHLKSAWSGLVATEIDDLHHNDGIIGLTSGHLRLAVYTPIHETHTGNVIAVLEFYQDAEELRTQLLQAELQSWGVTALVAFAMIAALFSIVSEGSKAIDSLRVLLSHRITQLKELLRQNEALRARVERTARNVPEANERFMPRMATDLRDGPAQSISLALLHLNALDRTDQFRDEKAAIRRALSEALRDVWNLSAILAVPEVESLTLRETVLFVVQDHERRTKAKILCNIADPMPTSAPGFMKAFAFRFVRVCLDSACLYGGGQDVQVSVWWDGQAVTIVVASHHYLGNVLDEVHKSLCLGLAGLWDQIESIGGAITVAGDSGGGAHLTARLPFIEERA